MASGKEIIAFFNRNGHSVCSICGNNAWEIVGMGDQNKPVESSLLPFLPMDGSIRIPVPGLPVVILICNKCSFIRIHATKLIDADISSMKKRDND